SASWSTYRVIRATNTGCPHARVVRMLVKRAYKVQIPCHSKFQCSFHGLRAEAASPCTVLELLINALLQIGADEREVNHMNTPKIDEIVRRLVESVPPGVRAVQRDLESNFRAVLRAS